MHAIKAATLTLLNNSLSSNKGNRKHGIKNVTARERRPRVTFHVLLLWTSNINLRVKAPRFSAWIVIRWTITKSLKTCNSDETSLGHQLYWKNSITKYLYLPSLIIIKMWKQYILFNGFGQSSHCLIIFWYNLRKNRKAKWQFHKARPLHACNLNYNEMSSYITVFKQSCSEWNIFNTTLSHCLWSTKYSTNIDSIIPFAYI